MKGFYEFKELFLRQFPEKDVQSAIRLYDAAETMEQTIQEVLGGHATKEERTLILALLGIDPSEPPKGAEFFRNEHRKIVALVRRMREEIFAVREKLLDKNREKG